MLRGHHRPPGRPIANGASEGGFAEKRGYWRRAERPEWAHSDPREAGYLPLRSLTIRDHRGGRAERPHSTSRPADRIANGAREGGFAEKGGYWRRAERPEWAHSDPGEAGYLPLGA